ncbi:MAG: DUF1559 domain-containing protein, partial [Planctomycetia bacterium]|nr:DUF1559 domain-containing protein [Planctomycetia bacterium]
NTTITSQNGSEFWSANSIARSNAIPSSKHPGGFLVTMCDGHTTFLSQDLNYRVYCLLMAPDNRNAKWPGQVAPNNVVQYPVAWGNPLTPLTDADLK